MKILIEDLKIDSIIGILPIERERPQTLILNAEIDYNYEGVYLDYVEIVEFLTTSLQTQQYGLLEDALHDLSLKIRQVFPPISHFSLSLKKPEILPNCTIGVKIESTN